MKTNQRIEGFELGTYFEEQMNDEFKYDIKYELVDQCPQCTAYIQPKVLYGIFDNYNSLSILFFCTKCNQSFLTKYKVVNSSQEVILSWEDFFEQYGTYKRGFRHESVLEAINPKSISAHIKQIEFSDEIHTVSPNFQEIYNQANAADELELFHLSGMGYRKALEFLVRDFVIYKNPKNADNLSITPFKNIIKDHFSNDPRITDVAMLGHIIGSDKAHFVDSNNFDLDFLKVYLQLIVTHIEHYVIGEEAQNILKGLNDDR